MRSFVFNHKSFVSNQYFTHSLNIQNSLLRQQVQESVFNRRPFIIGNTVNYETFFNSVMDQTVSECSIVLRPDTLNRFLGADVGVGCSQVYRNSSQDFKSMLKQKIFAFFVVAGFPVFRLVPGPADLKVAVVAAYFQVTRGAKN